MAKLAKSKDTANWRKGKDLKVGDTVLLWVNGQQVEATITTEPIKVPYMSVTNYKWQTSIPGRTVLAAGGEFVEGRY